MPRRIFQPTAQSRERAFEKALHLQALVDQQTLMKECEESFSAFVEESWRSVRPGIPFSYNWHIDAISEHLEALRRREIRNLIINIPPRSLKSTLVSVMFPAWVWLTSSEEKFLYVSYSKIFAMRDSRQTRSLIMSQWYQARWNSRFSLVKDQNEKGRFENNKGGYRLAGSVEGGVLGEGGSVIVLDDPNDLEKMQFPDYRQSVKDFYSNSLASRSIDPKTDVRLCVQQRSSYGDDMTSFLLELGGWEQLVIPCEMGERRPPTSIGWTDPRVVRGELMHPERLGPLEVQSLKTEMRANFDGQFNQQPRTDGGGSLRKEWFNFYNTEGEEPRDEHGNIKAVVIRSRDQIIQKVPKSVPSAFEQVIQSWDMAFKDEEDGSKVAGQAWGRVGPNTYLLGRTTEHRNFPETLRAVREMSEFFPCAEKLVEDKANGPAVIQTLKNEIPGLIAVNPEGGKWARVAAISGYVEAGNVWLPNPETHPWVWAFLDECAGVPKDDVDAMTQALKRLYDSIALSGIPEFRVQPRLGEVKTACHIATKREEQDLLPGWRRYVAVIPNGGALWFVERPSGSILVQRELLLEGIDAEEAGRRIARRSVGEFLAESGGVRNRSGFELFLPKIAFAPLDSGSWAELCEQGLLSYVPEEGDFNLREEVKEKIKAARFRFDQVEEEESSLDRLRALMTFQPPDFKEVPYDRKMALELRDDMEKFSDYLAQVRGEVRGEWPKLKISSDCKELIGQIGSLRRDRIEDAPPLVRALLLGVSVLSQKAASEGVKVIQWPAAQQAPRSRPGQGARSVRFGR